MEISAFSNSPESAARFEAEQIKPGPEGSCLSGERLEQISLLELRNRMGRGRNSSTKKYQTAWRGLIGSILNGKIILFVGSEVVQEMVQKLVGCYFFDKT